MINQLLTCLLLLSACSTPQKKKPNPLQDSQHRDWLIQVKSTGRISSNHFSDFVIDTNQNSYIASFAKGADARDYIYIAKVNSDGKTLWETGKYYSGRATAISIDSKQDIWVIGFYSDELQFGNHKLEKPLTAQGFLASFDAEGICLLLKKIPEASLFNCHVNKFDEILISGYGSKAFSIDGIQLKQIDNQVQFLAKFNPDGQCTWLESTHSTSNSVSRIRSDKEGNFYLSGEFNTLMIYQGDSLRTEGGYDNDGYLLKIDRNGRKQWLKQFGHKGTTRYGYRTKEGAFDIAFNKKEHIILGLCLEYMEAEKTLPLAPEARFVEIQLLKLDGNGNVIVTKGIIKSTNRVSGFALARTKNDQLWLSGSTQGKTLIDDSSLNFENPQSFILQLDQDWFIQNQIWPQHGNNTMFRVAYPKGDFLFFSGHFRNHIKIDSLEATNNGNHGLFLFKTYAD